METLTQHKKRQFAKLGYSHMDTAEIVTNLNKLVANYQIYFHKLQNYHWNVSGPDFFDLHDVFEKMYHQVLENTDQIAEKIRLFGERPYTSLVQFREQSDVKDGDPENAPMEMVKEVLGDLQTILSHIEDCIESASSISDFGSESMLKRIIEKHEKEYWKLSSWLDQRLSNQKKI